MVSSRFRGLVTLIAACLVLVGVSPQGAMAQDEGPQVTWEVYHVTVQVNEDGTLDVTESILIEFHDSFRQGERTIPMDKIESIDGVEVRIGSDPDDLREASDAGDMFSGEAHTFSAGMEDGDFTINYGFPRTSDDGSDSVRAVELSYTAHGAIRDYPGATPPEQQVRWTAVSEEITGTGMVYSARATIIFPEPVAESDLAIDPDPSGVEDDRVMWQATNLQEGESLQVAVAFPPITDAIAPAWQADADTYEGRQEHLPALNLIIGMVALVAWVIMILFMVVRGVRDPEVGLVADIIPNRPDDLAPPLVGALIDETVDTKDVLAGLLHLDQRGFITIREDGATRKGKATYSIVLNRPLGDAPDWERPMLEGLFGSGAPVGDEVDLAERLKKLREKSFSEISRAYEDALYDEGYFLERPQTTRLRWVRNMAILVLVLAAPALVIAAWAQQISGWVAVPAVITFIGLIVGGILTTKAAVKTTEGAIEAAKWKAYGRYLTELRKGPEPVRFMEAVEQDLPWAVALGFDSSWADLADDLSSPRAGDRDRRWHSTPIFVGASGLDTSGPSHGRGFSDGDGGGLQDASGKALSGIGGGSAGLFSMLNDAAASINAGASSGSSSGGGFSGSSSAGSSGGGGHSFS